MDCIHAWSNLINLLLTLLIGKMCFGYFFVDDKNSSKKCLDKWKYCPIEQFVIDYTLDLLYTVFTLNGTGSEFSTSDVIIYGSYHS